MVPEDVVQERIDAALVGMAPESDLHDRIDCVIGRRSEQDLGNIRSVPSCFSTCNLAADTPVNYGEYRHNDMKIT